MNHQELYMYLVVLVRNDTSLVFLETENPTQALDAQKALTEEWTACIKEQRPFCLPKVESSTSVEVLMSTNFSPSLLREIKVLKQTVGDYERSKNPYERRMRDSGGLQEFMNHNFRNK